MLDLPGNVVIQRFSRLFAVLASSAVTTLTKPPALVRDPFFIPSDRGI